MSALGLERHFVKTLTEDVVIIGSGGAGTYAALRMRELGLDPLVVTKGLVGKSGCSIFAGNLVLSGHMLGTTDDQAQDTMEYFTQWWNNFLIDQDYLVKAGAGSRRPSIPNSTRPGSTSGATTKAISSPASGACATSPPCNKASRACC